MEVFRIMAHDVSYPEDAVHMLACMLCYKAFLNYWCFREWTPLCHVHKLHVFQHYPGFSRSSCGMFGFELRTWSCLPCGSFGGWFLSWNESCLLCSPSHNILIRRFINNCQLVGRLFSYFLSFLSFEELRIFCSLLNSTLLVREQKGWP